MRRCTKGHHQLRLPRLVVVVTLEGPMSIVVELLRIEEGLVNALDLGLAADTSHLGWLSSRCHQRGCIACQTRIGRINGEWKSCLGQLIDCAIDFALLLPEYAVGVFVPDFVFLVVAAALDSALVADESAHLLVEEIGPAWRNGYLLMSLDLILSLLSSRKRI